MFTTTTQPAQPSVGVEGRRQDAQSVGIDRVEQPLPSGTWRMLAQRSVRRRSVRGLDLWWDGVIGRAQALVPRRMMVMRRAARVAALQAQFEHVSEARLRSKAEQLRGVFRRGRDKRRHADLAYALVGEIVYRAMGFRLHTVQFAAALAMNDGCLAELATGEGKTIAATLPAVIAGWRGRGCHVITVNDYLAKRDAHEMGPVYRYCGLRVAHVDAEMQAPDRQRAYLADVTYCTNKEVAADYLRDRLVLGDLRDLSSALLGKIAGQDDRGLDRLMLRGLECAIIDEADSVLIDEAVTPLIISGTTPNAEQIQAYKDAATLVGELRPNKDYRVDHRYHEVVITNVGRRRLAQRVKGMSGIWQGMRRREELVRQAISARELYQRDQQYVVQDGKIVIVDEFTGRLMPDRTWRDGLHQAVEAKEGVEVNPLKGTLARVSFQRFFRMYRKVAGMTGTAIENRQELWVIYHLPVVPIPTHKPVIRKQSPDRLYANDEAKLRAIVAEIETHHKHGRPVLIGSRSVGASERISAMLSERGMENQVLNAVRHAEEAQIVAGAGQKQRLTVATNMAGRGTDIKPGRDVREAGGLHVIATERHEAGRIDRQLFGRTGRQGDPGTVSVYLSLEDELFKRHAPTWVKLLLAARVHGDGAASGWLCRKLTDYVQYRAERKAFVQRKSVLKSDDWLEEYLGFAGREM